VPGNTVDGIHKVLSCYASVDKPRDYVCTLALAHYKIPYLIRLWGFVELNLHLGFLNLLRCSFFTVVDSRVATYMLVGRMSRNLIANIRHLLSADCVHHGRVVVTVSFSQQVDPNLKLRLTSLYEITLNFKSERCVIAMIASLNRFENFRLSALGVACESSMSLSCQEVLHSIWYEAYRNVYSHLLGINLERLASRQYFKAVCV
jgi:hypothetical protein